MLRSTRLATGAAFAAVVALLAALGPVQPAGEAAEAYYDPILGETWPIMCGGGTWQYSSEDPNGVVSPDPTADGWETLPTRISGTDRYATASAIVGEWDRFFDADIVFLATGQNFPDALSAGAAAVHLGAPLLLTEKNRLPASTRDRLLQLQPETIVVLGSAAAVSHKVVDALKALPGSPEVQRWAGSDRYATMREIVKRAWGVDGDGDGAEGVALRAVIVATGRNFPDALAAVAGAAGVGRAVVIVDGSKKKVPDATLKLIKDLQPERLYIAGSSDAVRCEIETQLDDAFPHAGLKRIMGTDRYGTASAIGWYFYYGADAAFVATAENFPDALAGAVLAGALRIPVLLNRPRDGCIYESVTQWLLEAVKERGGKIVLLGSSTAVKSGTTKAKLC